MVESTERRSLMTNIYTTDISDLHFDSVNSNVTSENVAEIRTYVSPIRLL